jgi:hypothetical protein
MGRRSWQGGNGDRDRAGQGRSPFAVGTPIDRRYRLLNGLTAFPARFGTRQQP